MLSQNQAGNQIPVRSRNRQDLHHGSSHGNNRENNRSQPGSSLNHSGRSLSRSAHNLNHNAHNLNHGVNNLKKERNPDQNKAGVADSYLPG